MDYFNKQSIILNEVVNWLLNNQNNSNSILLLGYFNYYGIGTSQNYEKAFDLFIDASKQNHILAQYYVGCCYQFGHGITKDKKLAFEYYEKVADKDFAGA